MTDYTNLALLKSALGISDSEDDALLTASITAASRAVDRITGTAFGVPAGVSARVYPVSRSGIWVHAFTDATGLVVKTGTAGTYSTTVDAAGYRPFPDNAVTDGGAYRQIVGYSTAAFGNEGDLVQVTARWGWHTIPADVEEATRREAARRYRLKDVFDGTGGSTEMGTFEANDDGELRRNLWFFLDHGIA